jgi:hypothetical protein
VAWRHGIEVNCRNLLLGLEKSMRYLVAILVVLILQSAPQANAWVYSEHRDISVAAVLKLDPEYRKVLDSLWRWARVGHEHRLSSSIVIMQLPEKPNYLDWAAWPAIGGDHACSPSSMLRNILTSDWIIEVVRTSEQFKRRMVSATTNSQRINALREQDLLLQRADPKYSTRASANNVHFLLARNSLTVELSEYLQGCLAQGGEINAFAAYTWFHYRALAKAKRLRENGLSDADRSKLALAALGDEAFAVHFLEDAFAAGHVAGVWGNTSVRKGTHDYYNQHGYETYSWNSESIVLLGDAYMRVEDIEAPATAVKTSLMQLADAASGREPYLSHGFNDREVPGLNSLDADTLDICTSTDIPARVANRELFEQLKDVVKQTPVPALKSGYGAMPRFRSELGGFVGLSPYVCAMGWNDDFSSSSTSSLGVGSVGLNLRFGLGLDGVTSESGDGLAFLEVGICNDNASTTTVSTDSLSGDVPSDASSIPARTSIATRVRLPYFLIPGDLIIGALLIAPFSNQTFTEMAVVAGNGGLLGWQSCIATPIGRLQFLLGREIGVQLYGFTRGSQSIYIQRRSNDNQLVTESVDLRSILIEAPIIEWRPFRTFSLDQHSSLAVQLCGTADIPVYWKATSTSTTDSFLHTRYGLSLRFAFDWRYYY